MTANTDLSQYVASEDDLRKFEEVSDMSYKRQGAFFLDAFWVEHSEDAETIYKYAQRFAELDPKKGEGNALEAIKAHAFLEKIGETMTVLALRAKLREIDINKDGRMSFLEYLINWSNRSVKELLFRSTNIRGEDLDKAEAALEAVQAEVERIEAEKRDLAAKSKGTGIKARQAYAMLFALENNDPLELNKMLINAGAALRKAKRTSVLKGSIFWIERDIAELKSYKPKGGINTKAFEGK